MFEKVLKTVSPYACSQYGRENTSPVSKWYMTDWLIWTSTTVSRNSRTHTTPSTRCGSNIHLLPAWQRRKNQGVSVTSVAITGARTWRFRIHIGTIRPIPVDHTKFLQVAIKTHPF
jgi:hypothetical protein